MKIQEDKKQNDMKAEVSDSFDSEKSDNDDGDS